MTGSQTILSLLKREQTSVSERAQEMVQAIKARHGENVRALLFYGSGRRDDSDPEKMLDYYVLVNSYHELHGWGVKALLSFLVPPSVHYLEITGTDGKKIRSKYSVISMSAFHRRTRGAAFETMLWARFSQPVNIMEATSDDKAEILETLEAAIRHFAEETAPLISGSVDATTFWTRGLCESYRTELRAEDAESRARDIVEKYSNRYTQLYAAIFAGIDEYERQNLAAGWSQFVCRSKWFLRRLIGKPMTAIRVLKAAMTFENGLDYVLYKLKSHSGVSIEISDIQRRHPVLFSPILAWKLYRQGAFR